MARLAARQFGVVSLTQLTDLGFTYAEVKGLVKDGHLHPLHRGVYVVGHRTVTNRAHLIGALLAMGPESFLSHRTSAAARGLRAVATAAIEVTVRADRTPRRPALTVHRTAAQPHRREIQSYNGLRVSSVPRMLIELAPRETPAELDRLITESIRKNLLDLTKMEATLAGHARRPGVAMLRTVLGAYRRRDDRKSSLERAFDELLSRHPEIPPPQRNVYLSGWEIDCWWPEYRVAVELDGRPYHSAIKDLERDRIKDAKLLGLDIRPLRITDQRFALDPHGALADLTVLLDRRRAA